ncbi:MAG: 16S rRNA (uracil(1498)-N(3))-methyltransferase [Chloroflexaceae bacterium]|nr:16S rRNA (uracil(1498)-N(3))-methyltransferase [Chloroflexaceae bacterium]
MSAPIANTYRFFVDPAVIAYDAVELTDPDLVRQIVKVLRLGRGDRILLLDGCGTGCTVELQQLTRERVAGRVVERQSAGGESVLQLTLFIALIRSERFEWVLQKGTELGVTRFVPVQFARSQAGDQPGSQKLVRWQRIIREAAEQSCRGRLPTLDDVQPFTAACQQAATASLALLLWEGQVQPDQRATPTMRHVVRHWREQAILSVATPIALMSGPEGGITSKELTSATGHGMILVSFGPRILRAETAPIAASAALFYEWDQV